MPHFSNSHVRALVNLLLLHQGLHSCRELLRTNSVSSPPSHLANRSRALICRAPTGTLLASHSHGQPGHGQPPIFARSLRQCRSWLPSYHALCSKDQRRHVFSHSLFMIRFLLANAHYSNPLSDPLHSLYTEYSTSPPRLPPSLLDLRGGGSVNYMHILSWLV